MNNPKHQKAFDEGYERMIGQIEHYGFDAALANWRKAHPKGHVFHNMFTYNFAKGGLHALAEKKPA